MYFENQKLVVTYYEAFAGLGATSIALDLVQKMLPQLSFKCVGHCENDPTANRAYELIHGDVPLDDDITTVNFENLPKIDLLSWTAPCTALSSAGKQKGFEEGSGTASALIWEIKRLLKVQKPSIIFFENVKDIESKKKFRSTWEKFRTYLEEEGYHLSYKIVDSSKMGWPQHRERFMMIATLDNIDFAFPEECRLKLQMSELLDKDNKDTIRYKRTINSFIDKALGEGKYEGKPAKFNNLRIHSLNDATMAFTITTNSLRITENFIWDTNIPFDNGILRVNKDNLGSMNLSREALHNAPIRRLSTNEAMLLMGVPKKYHKKLDTIPMTSLYKLLGNSIVIPTLRDVFYNFFTSMLQQVEKLNID